MFPVGRRLAFDAGKGRLWVVCRRCEKWNLSPLEERWEAIEACERLFADARARVSTDQIGLARLKEGLELVRIGEPKRPEFAAWRYGDQFGRRQRRARLMAVGAGLTGLGLLVAGPMFGGLAVGSYMAWESSVWATWLWRRQRAVGEVEGEDGARIVVRGRDVSHMRLVPSDSPQGWGLQVLGRSKRQVVLEGAEARQAAAILVPHLSPMGATRGETRVAVDRIESAGTPEDFLRRLVHEQKGRELDPKIHGWTKAEAAARAVTIANQGHVTCLAVEMAVNEENERLALEGELLMLEDAWREAEEVAAVSDSLLVPEGVGEQLRVLKAK